MMLFQRMLFPVDLPNKTTRRIPSQRHDGALPFRATLLHIAQIHFTQLRDAGNSDTRVQSPRGEFHEPGGSCPRWLL